MDEAFQDADIVYPKSWVDLSLFTHEEEALRLARKHSDWICDARRMALASPTPSTCTAAGRPRQ